ncbi:MAG TPA: class I tRNA ligase family protein, partial [Sedimentisphaerales bacterium]|nr:class I tRNA ligase family protein [Sedimentisphaerales bacterium]
PVRRLGQLVEAAPAEAAIVAPWPAKLDSFRNREVEAEIDLVQSVVRAIREVRNQYNIPPRKELAASARASQAATGVLMRNKHLISQLAGLSSFAASPDSCKPGAAAAAIAGEVEVYLHDVIDVDAEMQRLEKQKQQILGLTGSLETKLANENFLARAKPEVIRQSRDKLTELNEQLAALEQRLAELLRM